MILNSPYISGSLTVTGNTNLMGALTVTGSLAGTATSSSFAYTASSAVSAYTASSAVNATTALTASYANTFTVGGTLTAQTLVVQTITSSVSYITGSTRFGSTLSNTHTFTGSLQVTGSGPHYIYGNTILGGTSDLGSEAGTTHAIIQNNTLTNSRGLAFYANDGVQNPRTWILHSTTSGTQQLQFNSNWSSATGYASFAFLNGNVGIGTAAPASSLEVRGNIAGYSGSAGGAGNISVNADTSYSFITANNTGGYLRLGRDTSAGALYGYPYAGLVVANGDYPLIFGTNDTVRMFISGSGNVGIGTSALAAYATRFLQIHNSSGNSALRLTNSTTGTTRDDGFDIEMRTSDVYLVARDAGFNMLFGTQDTGRMFISASGNVGIGTTTPTYKLTVVGPATANGITLNLDDAASSANSRHLFFTRSSSTASIGIAGSQANDPLWISRTGGYDLMVTSAGNVGIGTSTPAAKLDVSLGTSGSVYVKGTSYTQALLSTWYTNGSSGANPVNNFSIQHQQAVGQDHAWTFRTEDAYKLRLSFSNQTNWVSYTDVLTLTNGGKVGIGTSPDTKLHLYDGTNPLSLKIQRTTVPVYLSDVQTAVTTAGAAWTHNMENTSNGSVSWGGFTNTSYAGSAVMLNADTSTSWITFHTAAAPNTNPTERMRVTGGGQVYLGDGYSQAYHRINWKVAQGGGVLTVSGYSTAVDDSAIFYACDTFGANAGAAALKVGKNTSTSRSINAGGTINASGADYAEYMTKAVEDNIAKGDIVGINSDAKLTNVFADAISFAVKSTDPSYVGGDNWFNEEKTPSKTTDQTEEEFAPILAAFEARLEIERAKVDRISFSGQVPCNVYGAQVGDYIVPISTEDGKITGQAITNPTFQQYQIAVGKVWKIMEDGRAWIAIKIG